MLKAAFNNRKENSQTPKIKVIEKKPPAFTRSVDIFLKKGSNMAITFPIHLTGCGRPTGSPAIKSRIKAAKRIFDGEK